MVNDYEQYMGGAFLRQIKQPPKGGFFICWIDGRFKPQRRGSKKIAGRYFLATKGSP